MAEPAREALATLPLMERLDRDAEAIARDFRRYRDYHLGRFPGCDDFYLYEALAYTVRDRLMSDWRRTWIKHKRGGRRRAFYLSLEYLIGRSLGNHLLNMGLESEVARALGEFALSLEAIESAEPDAGLGNGGLGRLADKVFRIGHLGDFNEPMVTGTLASVESGLALAGIPHTPGGVTAALAYLQGNAR